jgi:hypothetical protein
VKFAYADPPYLGQCKLYKHAHPEGPRPFDGRCWDDSGTHRALVCWLLDTYPDGWVMSASSPSLLMLGSVLPVTNTGLRIGAWVKPFASFKPGINPGYCWEPVVFGGRKRERNEDTVRDFVSANIVLEKGTIGAKPPAFCAWVLDLMGFQAGDTFDDVFTGSGVFGRVRDAHVDLWRNAAGIQ